MDSKGGGSQPSSQTVNQSNLPEYARPYFENLMNSAQGLSQQPYAAYGGQRLQQLSGNQNQSIGMAGQLAGQTPWQVNAGSQGMMNAGIGSMNAAQNFNPGNVGQWMSPYAQNVIQNNLTQANRQFDIQDMNRRADPNAQGALGGYRDVIASAENNRNRNFQLQQIQDSGMQNAYQSALGAMGQQSQLGMQGFNALGQASAGLGTLGVSQRELQREGMTDLERTGALQQAQGQRALDISYTDFRNAQDFPRQQANFMSGILRGVPVSANSDVQQYNAAPNAAAQLLGMGIAGAGISKMAGQ